MTDAAPEHPDARVKTTTHAAASQDSEVVRGLSLCTTWWSEPKEASTMGSIRNQHYLRDDCGLGQTSFQARVVSALEREWEAPVHLSGG